MRRLSNIPLLGGSRAFDSCVVFFHKSSVTLPHCRFPLKTINDKSVDLQESCTVYEPVVLRGELPAALQKAATRSTQGPLDSTGIFFFTESVPRL